MTTITMTRVYDGAVLTDEAANSSCGIPVLRVGSADYGPADLVPTDPERPTVGPRTAAAIVSGELMARHAFVRDGEADLTAAELAVARRFLASWPGGPQFSGPPQW